MADTENRGSFPDSISSDRLRELARGLTPQIALSHVIPELAFRDPEINSGGIADLQFVVMQLIEKSKSGVDIVQLLTATLYLFQHCYTIVSEGVDEAQENLTGDEKLAVVAELTSFKLVFANILSQLSELHLGTCAQVTIDRVDRLRTKLGEESGQQDYASHLLLSQALLDSLGLTREEVQQFISNNSPLL